MHSLTDCIAYMSTKVAHATASGVNHRTKIGEGAPAKAYKCTLRRDFVESIAIHLQVLHSVTKENVDLIDFREYATHRMIELADEVSQQYAHGHRDGFDIGTKAGIAADRIAYALYGGVIGTVISLVTKALVA